MSNLFPSLDPRARLLLVFAAIVIVSSTPHGVLWPFAIYIPLTLLLAFMSKASGFYLLWRCMAASPFILLAAGLLALQSGFEPPEIVKRLPLAASVALKGFTAAWLLAFLTATTPLAELLWALRKLKAPESLNVILGMMYRYTSLLSEEYARQERARDSRTVRPLGRRRYGVYGRQLGTMLLRSWDRAERVHAAMLSRGFTGSWPEMQPHRLRAWDISFAVLSVALFLAGRLIPF